MSEDYNACLGMCPSPEQQGRNRRGSGLLILESELHRTEGQANRKQSPGRQDGGRERDQVCRIRMSHLHFLC